MDLYKAYNQMNSLISKITENRNNFRRAADKAEGEMLLVKEILKSFDYPFNNIRNQTARFMVSGKINLSGIYEGLIQPFGEVVLHFKNCGDFVISSTYKENSMYYALKNTTSDELETILNIYSPEKLEVKELIVTENDATVRVILKGLEVS